MGRVIDWLLDVFAVEICRDADFKYMRLSLSFHHNESFVITYNENIIGQRVEPASQSFFWWWCILRLGRSIIGWLV